MRGLPAWPAALLLIVACPAQAQFNQPLAVPGYIDPVASQALDAEREQLVQQFDQLSAMIATQNSSCGQVRSDDRAGIAACQASQSAILAELARYNSAVAAFARRVDLAPLQVYLPSATQFPGSQQGPIDARGFLISLPPGMPRLQEVERSPGREAWLRGMDAVVLHDWELASAWFETALLRDPGNDALTKAAALALWTRDYYRRVPPSRSAAVPASALQVPNEADLKLLFGLLQEERASFASAQSPVDRARIQLPEPADEQFLADLMLDRARDPWRLEELFSEPTAQSMRREMSSMTVEEILDAQKRTQSPETLEAARSLYARDLLHIALVQAERGDLRGALQMAGRAVDIAPETAVYRRIRDALRDLSTQPQSLTGLAPGV